MQFTYGWATATEVAYYAYIYAVVDKEKYLKVTSYVRGATQAGKCIAYAVSQVIISTAIGNYFTLNYISFSSMILIFFIALCLPWVGWRNSELILQNANSRKELRKESYRYYGSIPGTSDVHNTVTFR